MSAPNIETSSAPSVVTGGAFGTKVGNSITETVGFYGYTGVAQPAAIANAATDAASAIAQLNLLLAQLRLLGLIAS